MHPGFYKKKTKKHVCNYVQFFYFIQDPNCVVLERSWLDFFAFTLTSLLELWYCFVSVGFLFSSSVQSLCNRSRRETEKRPRNVCRAFKRRHVHLENQTQGFSSHPHTFHRWSLKTHTRVCCGSCRGRSEVMMLKEQSCCFKIMIGKFSRNIINLLRGNIFKFGYN